MTSFGLKLYDCNFRSDVYIGRLGVCKINVKAVRHLYVSMGSALSLLEIRLVLCQQTNNSRLIVRLTYL